MSASTSLAAIDVAKLKDALRDDKEFFIQFFIGNEITQGVPAFHVRILEDMCNTNLQRVAEAVPRGHAKTTLAKLAAAWHLINEDRIEFVAYLSNTATLAIEACRDIANFFTCDNFVAVFGPPEFLVERAGDGFFIIRLPGLSKTCTIRALGKGKQVRGLNIRHRRPQLAVIDDLEDEETADSDDQFRKMKIWLYGAFIKALNKGWNKIIHIGNIHGRRSQLHEHIKSEFWASRQYGALLATGKPLWPEVWPMEALRRDMAAYQEQGLAGTWFAEMMNSPMMSEMALIRPEEIYYCPALIPGDSQYGFLSVDVAVSKESWAHKSAVAVHLWNPHFQVWQIVEIFLKKGIDIIDLYDVVSRLLIKWRLSVVGFESYAFQASIASVYKMLAITRHPFNTFEFLPVNHGSSNKTTHIAAWASMLKATSTKQAGYALTKGDWICTQQLLSYDARVRENDDDAIDACSYGPQIAQHYMGRIIANIESQGRYGNTPLPRSGTYQVSAV